MHERPETLQLLERCRALIRFIGSIRVREIRVNEIRVRGFRVKANQGAARLRVNELHDVYRAITSTSAPLLYTKVRIYTYMLTVRRLSKCAYQ